MKPPFHSGSGPVPYKQFAGREDFRQRFWDFVNQDDAFVWVIEGHRGYGKSSLGDWCYKASIKAKNPPLVCYYDLRVHFNGPNEISPSTFYNGLAKTLIAEASDRYPKIWAREKGKKFASWISKVETPLGKIPEIKFNLNNLADVLQLIGRYRTLLSDEVSSVVIIIDEVSRFDSDTSGQTIKLCAALAECLERFGQDDKPNVGLILLPLPNWPSWLGSEWTPSRYITIRDRLQPFTAVELNELLQTIFRGTKWNLSNRYEQELRMQSGGHPHLVQSIGFESCGIALSSEDLELKQNHVEVAVKRCYSHAGSKILRSLNGIFDSAEIYLDELKGDMASQRIMSAISNVDRQKVLEGLTPDGWFRAIREVLHNGTRRQDFDRVWGQISQSDQIMDSQEGKYRFIGEALRSYVGNALD